MQIFIYLTCGVVRKVYKALSSPNFAWIFISYKPLNIQIIHYVQMTEI